MTMTKAIPVSSAARGKLFPDASIGSATASWSTRSIAIIPHTTRTFSSGVKYRPFFSPNARQDQNTAPISTLALTPEFGLAPTRLKPTNTNTMRPTYAAR